MVTQAAKPAIFTKIRGKEAVSPFSTQISQPEEIYQFNNLRNSGDNVDTGTNKSYDENLNSDLAKNRFSSNNELFQLAYPDNSYELFLLFYIPDQTQFLNIRSNYFSDQNLETYSIKAKDKLENQDFELAIEERYEAQMKWPKTFSGVHYNALF